MSFIIKYRVPYQIRVRGTDSKSGKTLTNTFYLRSGETSGSPAYGGIILGSSSTTVLNNFITQYKASVIDNLSVNWTTVDYTMREIVGWKYGKPFFPIVAATSILTGTAFGIAGVLPKSTPFFGNISGIGGLTNANGIWTITPTSLNTFTTTADTSTQTGFTPGTLQEISDVLEWLFGDLDTVADTTAGSVTGEALPLFSDVSGRRTGSTVGRAWQGRNSYAPIGESQQLNGKLTPTALADWTTGLAAMVTSYPNGASFGTGVDNMFLYNASFKNALTLATPFTGANLFTSVVQSMFPQPNLGSMVKRKPKLTAVIS